MCKEIFPYHMQNTKIVKLIKSLNQYEIRAFKDFVHSPFFNKNKNVSKLFDELKKFYPKFTGNDLSEESIYKKIFPGEKFDYFKLKNAVSDLFKLSKEFLSFTRIKLKGRLKEKFLLEELRERNLDSIFEQSYKSAVKQNEETLVKDENYVLHKMDLTEEFISYNAPKRPNENLNLQQVKLDLFTKYSIIRFLKSYNLMMHEEKQNNLKFDKRMFDEVLKYIEKSNFEDNPTLLVYYNIIMLEKNREDTHFYKLKSLREKYSDELNDYDRYMIFLHMNGYCTHIYNIHSRTDFFREQFEIVKEKNSRESTVTSKLLYPDFLNEVKIAVRVNEFKWADEYIEKNKHKFQDEKESTLNFCYGLINYKKGNYEEALSSFSKTYFPNFIIKLQVKILQLQIYFEMGYYEQAISMIDTFRHYLKREETIKEDFKISFYEFLRLTNDLIKLESGYYEKDNRFYVEKLKSEISNMTSNQFGIRLWLSEKIDIHKS
ncbi:MAG: hypothetical protein ABI462_12290 [Ignavibacteria bacterium]